MPSFWPEEIIDGLGCISKPPQRELRMALRCRQMDFDVGSDPCAFVIEQTGFLLDARRWLKEVFPDNSNLAICADQPLTFEVVETFVFFVCHIETVIRFFTRDQFTAFAKFAKVSLQNLAP